MDTLIKREQVKREDIWAIEDLYGSDQEMRKDAEQLEKDWNAFGAFRGHLSEGSGVLLNMLNTYAKMSQRFEKLYVYANQKMHEDMGNSKYQQMAGETQVMMNTLNSATSFMVPEILQLSGEQLEAYYKGEPDLLHYRHYLNEIMRQKEHTLDTEKEEMLARAGQLGQSPSNIYAMFNNADIAFPPVQDEQGELQPLTQGRYSTYLESQDRRVRKEAFTNLYSSYAGFKNTLGAVYEANAKQAAFFAKERKYGSALEAALDDSSIPVQVYDRLIESVQEHMEPMHRYMRIRKRAMGLDELHMYDIHVPMVEDIDMKIPYAKAKEIVKEGLAPLGEDYLKLLQEGFDQRWIDVYENEGKRTGAYSWGAYGIHPYVLLNYQENLNNVFTLAHEMGHALHSYYSDAAQEYIYAGYKIFVAEVASTCNEALLIHHLIEKSTDKKEKAYLVNYFLNQFRATLYRQTMFAEFEKSTHKVVNEGGTLTSDTLCQVYYHLNRNYYGPDVVCDEEIQYEWGRIPHFYTPFYVYQYATGFSAAIAISSKILRGEPGIVDKYKQFLSGGSSKTPIELLQICGVDMTSSEPVETALKVFEEYVSELEQLL